MKKFVTLFLAIFLTLTFAACASSGKSDDGVSLVLNGAYVVTDEVVSAITIDGQEVTELTFEGNSLTYAADGDAEATATYEIKGGKLTFGGHSMSFDKEGGTIIINGVTFGKKPKNAETAKPIESASAEQTAPTASPTPATNVSNIGNAPGNLVNTGLFAKDGKWLYFSNSEDNFSLYKERLDGGQRVKLNNELSTYINVDGDWLYYATSNSNGSFALAKIRTDGTSRTLLADDIDISAYGSVVVVGDWVYFTTVSNSSLYKIRLDGSEKILITDSVHSANVVGDWIYYCGQGEHSETDLFKIRTDGTGKTRLGYFIDNIVIADSGWLYFTIDDNLRRCLEDGSDNTLLSETQVKSFNVAGGWVYFSSSTSIYKIQIDGTGLSKLDDTAADAINVIGDWLYYVEWATSTDSSHTGFFRIRTDGTGRTKFLGFSGSGVSKSDDAPTQAAPSAAQTVNEIEIIFETAADNPSRAEMQAAASIICDRLEIIGQTGATADIDGTKRIVVRIPDLEYKEMTPREIVSLVAVSRLTFRDESGKVLVDGNDIADAYPSSQDGYNGSKDWVVSIEFNMAGTEAFAQATAANIGKPIYIYLDEDVISAPTVNSGIYDGRAIISGSFTSDSARELAALIKAGALPFGLNVVSTRTVTN